MRRSKAFVERIEAKTVARWCGHDAGCSSTARPRGENREEIGSIPGGAGFLAKLIWAASRQHGQEGGELGDILDEQLGVARGVERSLRSLGLRVESFQCVCFQ